jgi:GntR family transcriptional repressor for pyruvate dehydrogenase complex
MLKEKTTQSAKQRFISIIEQKILSGELAVEQKLPPERELAEQTGMSRITVHAALVELATKNVLRIVPRQGTYVNDFKKEGTLELYGALMQYTGRIGSDLFKSLIEFREIVETAAAEMAAVHHTPENLENMRQLHIKELAAQTADEAAEYDYSMHLEIAKASGNIVLPMAMRSIEAMYRSLVKSFYEVQKDRSRVYAFHERLIAAIKNNSAKQAREIMKTMLEEGGLALEKHFETHK